MSEPFYIHGTCKHCGYPINRINPKLKTVSPWRHIKFKSARCGDWAKAEPEADDD